MAVARRHEELLRRVRALRRAAPRRMGLEHSKLESLRSRVRALDPQLVLRRGYALTYDEQGRLLRSGEGLTAGQRLRVRLYAADLSTRLESVRPRPVRGDEPDRSPEESDA